MTKRGNILHVTSPDHCLESIYYGISAKVVFSTLFNLFGRAPISHIKLSPITANTVQCHNGINIIDAIMHNNPSVTDTHRNTYLQKPVTKEMNVPIEVYHTTNLVLYTLATLWFH